MASPPIPVPGASSPEVAIQKIIELTTCPVCFETFLEPKTIPDCLHVLCLACLERAVARSRENLTCPMCRKPIEVPEGGVAALQTAYHINNLIEVREALRSAQSLDGSRGEQEDGVPAAAAPATCSKCPGSKAEYFCPKCSHFLCQDCRTVHGKWPEFSSHVPSLLTWVTSACQPSAPISQVCICHNSEPVTHYCLDCKVLMCVSCAWAVEHRGHAHSNINELVHQCKDTIVACLEPVRLQLGSLEGTMERVRCRVTHITQQAADTKVRVDGEIESMQTALEDRRKQLNEEVDRLADEKLHTLHTQEEVLGAAKGQLSDYLKVINHGLQRASAQQVILMRQAVEERVKEILVFSQLSRSPVEEANIGIFFSRGGGANCGEVGMVYSTSVTASKCCVVGRGLRWVVVGEEASVTVTIAKDECKDGQFDRFKLELSVDSCKVVVTRQEIREEQREIQIYYIFLTKGEHILHITLFGGEVSNSPFGVRALPPLQFRGTFVTAITGLRRPWGLSVTSSGNLVVVDNQGFDGIHIFSPSGSKLKSFAPQAFVPSIVLPEGKCYEPRGVTVTKDGSILLVDGKGHRVQRFSSDGRSVFVIGSLGKCCLEFNDPVGIAVTPSGNILVCDRRNHRVQVLTTHLTYIYEVGQLGTGEADLSLPYDVACDSKGCIYVADCGNYCVKVFSPEGTFLKKIGARGNERGHFQFITSICIDRNDRLYVVDKERACVIVFDPNGDFRMQFGTAGQMEGQFVQPMGITVDGNGLVYVSDGYSPSLRAFGRVQIFQ